MESISIRQMGVDIANIISLFHRLGTKKPGQNVDPEYLGHYIKTSIVLVGKRRLVAKWGSDPYVNYIRKATAKGVDVFYILARGRLNTFTAMDAIRRLESEDPKFEVTDLYQEEEYCGGTAFPGACIACLVFNQ